MTILKFEKLQPDYVTFLAVVEFPERNRLKT